MNKRDIIRAEAELDMLKDKARETDELAKENLELRRKIDKAIEHIEEHTENIDRGKYYEDYVETYDLLKILKGEDNEL